MKIFDKYFKDGYDYEINWNYVKSIPEFAQLEKCEQTPVYHKEGNAWNHTKMVVDEMRKRIEPDDSIETGRMCMMAALFHDIGKGVTTVFKNGGWHSYNHEIEGEKITRRILWNEDKEYREKVCKLVRWHMEIAGFVKAKDAIGKCAKILANLGDLDYKYLIRVMESDVNGMISDEKILKRDGELINELKNIMDGISNISFTPQLKRNLFYNEPITKDISSLPRLIMMVGLPGSGKNTCIERYISKDSKVLSRDDIRYELGMCGKDEKIVGTSEQENIVSNLFNSRLGQYAKEGRNIVINNINIIRKYRDEIKKAISKYDYQFVYVYCEAPTLEDNIERRKGMIEKDVFDKMINRFDFPLEEEYDRIFYYKSTKESAPFTYKFLRF